MFKNLRIQTKIIIVMSSIVTIILLAIGLYLVQQQESKLYADTQTRMQEQVTDLGNVITTQVKANQLRVNNNGELGFDLLKKSGSLTLDYSNTITITAIDQASQNSSSITIPKMTLNGNSLYKNFDFVDYIGNKTEGWNTIFQRIPNGFLRIATNITNDNGERAVNTYIPSNSEVCEALGNGKTYKGRAVILGQWYQTIYIPIFENGKVIGAYFYGLPEKDMSALKDIFTSKKYFETGYPFAIDKKGDFVIHPQKEGENASNEFFFEEMVKLGTDNGHVEYPWEGQNKMLEFSYLKDIDLYVATTIYEHEFMQIVNHIIWTVVIFLILGIIASIIVAKMLSNNIASIIQSVQNQIKSLTEAAIDGKLKTRANPEDTNFEFREIVVGINQTLDALILPLNVTAEYVDRISKGDLPEIINDEYKGDFNTIKNNINSMIVALNDVTEKAKLVSVGNLNVELTLRSDKDELMKSLQNMVHAFKEISDKAKLLAKGDLTIDLKMRSNEDELVKSLSEMVKALSGIVIQVQTAADSIAGASQQMSSNAQQVSQGASEQASAAEEVSSSMEEMGSNIQQNTQNAQQTEKISITAAQGMEKIKKSSNESLKSIKEIADKITIIGDIAFQTNILALNAAVEAARAGEHGKGFAVVAAEVRKLAERSKVAAEEIDSLSKSSVGVTNEASRLMEEIIPDVERTSKLVQEITAGSIEQNSGANQINNAINQLNQVTQQNAAAAEEMATSSEELAGHAQQLNELIGFFKVDENEVKKVSSNLNNQKSIEHKSFKSKSYNSEKLVKASQNKGININIEDNDSEFERF